MCSTLRIKKFHVVVVQWTSKKFTRECDARAELLLYSKTNCFLFLLSSLSSSWMLKVPVSLKSRPGRRRHVTPFTLNPLGQLFKRRLASV